ncbi:pyrimidine dimer DNA glycosylase/endonuclease V [Microbacterium rhizophilus]|uniref:pyrimidine dimer DNA glycosylase/endonuclease V n=1 Tax=Microbacterium rhizophilus TaxID=3138934 RepID=UPI0031EF5574
MRLWSLHPSLLDRQGLTAAWREALLAQAVLLGRTRGYTRHPQLERFRAQEHPAQAIGAYLATIAEDATRRGYRFDETRIDTAAAGPVEIPVTSGQIEFEWQHLLRKLAQRSPDVHAEVSRGGPILHPLFTEIPGEIASWERG